jgi:hypothetical protein
VGADVPLSGDPLAEPFLELRAGTRDRKGITELPQPKKKPLTLARHELVRPLKSTLRGMGYGTVVAETAEIDWHTRVALRDFQRDALTGARTRGAAAVTVPVTFTGAITGEFDEATWKELREWRAKGYASPRMLYVQKNAKRILNVNFCSRELTLGDAYLTRLDPLPSGGLLDDVLGQVSAYKSMFGLMHVYDKNDARKTDYRVWVAAAGRPGATWKKRVVCEVAWNECWGVFESLNTYDYGFLSMGLFHWTLGTGRGEDTSGLAGVVHNCLPAAEFERLVKPLGLGTLPVEPKVPPAWMGIQSARFTLDGQPLKGELKDEMRSLHWAARMVELAHTPEFQLAIHNAAIRQLELFLDLKLVKWGEVKVSCEQLLQTEQMRAFALDHQVNRPNTVTGVLQSCVDALRDPTLIASKGTDPKEKKEGVKPPTTWNTETGGKHTAALQALEQACVDAKTSEIVVPAGGAVPNMTVAQVEAFRGVYEFRREHFGTVERGPTRWKSILNSSGKSALGAIGTGIRAFPA